MACGPEAEIGQYRWLGVFKNCSLITIDSCTLEIGPVEGDPSQEHLGI